MLKSFSRKCVIIVIVTVIVIAIVVVVVIVIVIVIVIVGTLLKLPEKIIHVFKIRNAPQK